MLKATNKWGRELSFDMVFNKAATILVCQNAQLSA